MDVEPSLIEQPTDEARLAHLPTIPSRLARGHLPTLARPELPLMLLADPGAAWWWKGACTCAEVTVMALALGCDARRGMLARTLLRWAAAQPFAAPPELVRGWDLKRQYQQAAEGIRRCDFDALEKHLGRIVWFVLSDYKHEPRTRALLALARQLRVLNPLRVDLALDALARLEQFCL